jgi:glycosyltransferase involved in cell wall biosynthesis
MPGTAELQSLVTLEAMSASTPVLLANAMALPHLVRDGENGYLFTPGNSSELASRITALLRLPEDQLQAMGKTSREMVEPHSIQGTLQTFEDLYRGASYEDKAL